MTKVKQKPILFDGKVRNLIYKSKTGVEIPFGFPTHISLNKIEIHHLNRAKVIQHVLLMVDKITEDGWLDTIKVFCGKDGDTLYLTAEGAHRIMALRILFGDDSDIPIPVLMLPSCYDSADVEQTLEVIISFNKDNRAWTMRDYVEGWASAPNRKIYQEMLSKMDKHIIDNVTNAQICSIYTGQKSVYSEVKSGDFSLHPKYVQYVDTLLHEFVAWKKQFGVSKTDGFFPTYSQNVIVFMWSKIKYLFGLDFVTVSERFEYFEGFLSYYHTELHTLMRVKRLGRLGSNPLPTDTAEANTQCEGMWEEYISDPDNELPSERDAGLSKFIKPSSKRKTQPV